MSLYKALNADPSCSDAELKQAFMKSALRWHPDKESDPGKKPRAERMFKEVNQAYAELVQQRKLSAEMGLGRARAAGQASPGQSAHAWQNAGHHRARPAGAGMGNAERDYEAYRRAYAKPSQRMPVDAPRRIATFAAGVTALGLAFNFVMLRKAQVAKVDESENSGAQLQAGRSSVVSVTKPDIYALWKGLRQRQKESPALVAATAAEAIPAWHSYVAPAVEAGYVALAHLTFAERIRAARNTKAATSALPAAGQRQGAGSGDVDEMPFSGKGIARRITERLTR